MGVRRGITARPPTLTARVTTLEIDNAKMTLTLEEINTQLNKALAGLASAADTAKQNTASCQELRVTTERLLKSQDNVANKVDALET